MSEMIREVAVIAESGFTPFEFGIACEVFAADRRDEGVPRFDFRVVTPAPGIVVNGIGLGMEIPNGLDAADTADVVVVLPVPTDTWGHAPQGVCDTIRAAVERGAWVIGVCGGSFRIAESGVLDGWGATAHWRQAGELAALFPNVCVDPDALYVQHERVITSAGSAAGIDACLHLLRQTIGAEHANTIARRMVVSPQRDGSQAQFISRPLPRSSELSLAATAAWALGRLESDLEVAALAAHAMMSERTFARRFVAEFGVTPAVWVTRQRIALAQRLLEQTDDDVETVATRCGFTSAAVLRQNFARVTGTTPTSYRRRFSALAV